MGLKFNPTTGKLDIVNKGDITSVIAGSGLSGGGTSGDVTITNVDKGSSAVSSHEGLYSHDLIATALQSETDPVFTAWDKDYDDLTNKPDLTQYLKLDASNGPVTGQLDVNNVLTATDFRGYGGVYATGSKGLLLNPATTSAVGLIIKGLVSQSANLTEWQKSDATVYAEVESDGKFHLLAGLKSPYTRTVVVDKGGKGDYTTVKAACDYVATQTRGIATPWLILVVHGDYSESPFTIPTYTTVKTLGFNSGGTSLPRLTGSSLTSGNFITMGTLSQLAGFYIDISQSSGATGETRVISGTTSSRIKEVFISGASASSTHEHIGIYSCWAINFTISLSGTKAVSAVMNGTQLRNGWIYNTDNILIRGLSGNNNIQFIRFGAGTGGSTATYDIQVISGSVTVNNSPTRKITGTVYWTDTAFNTGSGVREAVLATDIPLSIKGASGQSANLTEWQNSSGTVLDSIDKDGMFTVNKIVTGTSTDQYGAKIYCYNTGSAGAMGVYGDAITQNYNGTVTSVTGVQYRGIAQNSTADNMTVTNVYGGAIFARESLTGTGNLSVGSQYALILNSPSVTKTGDGTLAITNAYGLRINNQGNAYTTNSYGLYLAAQSGSATSNYAIYVAGGVSRFLDDIEIDTDTNGLKLGAGQDATIYYDGTNLLLNPKAVGTGYLNIQGQTLVDDKIMFTQTDGNEAIDSANDGYMDYYATTLHRFNNPLAVANIKSGATQVGAGAGANELWKTSGHATLPDNVIMIGV